MAGRISEVIWSKGGRSRYQGGCLHLLDYPGSLVPCMENMMTEERLKEVKASKSPWRGDAEGLGGMRESQWVTGKENCCVSGQGSSANVRCAKAYLQ